MAHDDEDAKWDAYPHTVLEFCGPPTLRVDLRRPLSDVARRAIAALALGGPFAVLTAENPGGENPEDAPSERRAEMIEAGNERRTSALQRELEQRGVRHAPVDGMAPDGAYREHCLAVALPRVEAVALARRLDQLALFWFDGHDFWLLPAEADAEPERLPRGE